MFVSEIELLGADVAGAQTIAETTAESVAFKVLDDTTALADVPGATFVFIAEATACNDSNNARKEGRSRGLSAQHGSMMA